MMAGESSIVRRVLSAIPWRKLSYDEARALALKGEHLVEREGQLVGAPRGVGLKELPEVRAKVDEAAVRGRSNAGWYDDARASNTEMSGGDPQRAVDLAAGQAIYSNEAPPAQALGYTLGQYNRTQLEGPKAASRLIYRTGRQAKEYARVLSGADPEEELGPKTSPYFRQMNPEDEAAHAVGVNDEWMGRAYGYKPRASGFSESEHSWMTGENLLGRERADLAGIFPEGTPEGVQPWQAAVWAGQRRAALRAKYPDMPEEELERLANAKVSDAMEGFTYGETTEQIPSRGSKHLEGAVDLPLERKDELTRMLRASKPGEYDPYYEAMGMAQRPSAQGLGQFTETVADDGPPRFQPAFKRADTGEVQPVVGFHDMTQVPDHWMDALDDAGNGIDAGFVDQRGTYYTRQQAAALVRELEQQQAAEGLPSRRPLTNKVGESIPYIGSAERAAYEQQYLKNVRDWRGSDKTYVEDEVPLALLEQMHGEPLDKLRTDLYAKGYKVGAPPNRVLLIPNEDGTFKVLDGNRRLVAARKAGKDSIPALIERAELKPEGLTSERLTTRETHFGEGPKPKTDYNPNQTLRPMVSFAKGSTEHPELAAPEQEMLRGVNVLRSAVDVQAAGAGHIVKPTSLARLQNAASVVFPEPLDRELTSILYERAQSEGLNLIDRGGGNFTLTGDFGQMKAGEFKKRAAGLLAELSSNGAAVRLGKYIGQYNELPQYGEGRVTKYMLEQVTPRVGKKLDTPELRAHWLKKNRAEGMAQRQFDLGEPRADVQRLRALLAKGGPEGVRKHVKKLGYAGLPGIAAFFGEGDER